MLKIDSRNQNAKKAYKTVTLEILRGDLEGEVHIVELAALLYPFSR